MTRAAPSHREADSATAGDTRQGRASQRLAPKPYGLTFADSATGSLAEPVSADLSPLPAGRSASVVRRACSSCDDEENGVVRRETTTGNRAAAPAFGPSPAPAAETRAHSASSLTIGHADDTAEREADTMAEQALMGLPMLRPLGSPPTLRRMCAACAEDEGGHRHVSRKAGPGDRLGGGAAPPAVASLLAQPGRSLDPAARTFFERRFARSFDDVAIHDGPAANSAARSIGARAFTAGSHIAFAHGEYAPATPAGQRLLAHELAHVVQQSATVRRAPDKPADKPAHPTPLVPKSAAIADVMAVYAKLPPTDIKQYFVVKGNNLTVYDKAGKRTGSFSLTRPGAVDIKGFYLGSPFYQVGWGWLSQTTTGDVVVEGLSPEGQKEAKKSTTSGQLLQLLDVELSVYDWIKDADLKRFWEINEHGLTAMAVINTPLKELKGSEQSGPALSFDLPSWFKALKGKVEKSIADDRAGNKDDPNLPDKIIFYGSDKVQAQKGSDAWTIEVEKGKREAYLTVLKKAWDEASDKDAYAREITGELYKKVKLIRDDEQLKKDEQKEITEIDGFGAKKKGSKWGWALTLKQRMEELLASQRSTEAGATNFPDKLTLQISTDGEEPSAHVRVWVYDNKDAGAAALPELRGGTLPAALQQDDRAEDWVPIVRKAAEALRTGAVTTEPGAGGEDGAAGGDPAVHPAYGSLIHPVDLNHDLTTATVAKNVFRMVVDVDSTHGGNLLHRTTIHMALSIGYSWFVYALPDDLKASLAAARAQGDVTTVVEKTNDYVRTNRTSLGQPKTSYAADRDWDQTVAMSSLGEGDYFVAGVATIGYPSDWNMKRQASLAALPFTVMKAEDIAKSAAYADSDALGKLKAQLAAEKDEKKKALLVQQIADLEFRENHTLDTITKKDIGDTQKLIDTAIKLRKFIESDWAANKEHDTLMLMFRLKAFDKEHNENLYGVYMIVRQIFDLRYDDKYAVTEYIKIVERQKADLSALRVRSGRVTDNPKLRKDKPLHRSVAALVKEDDGNLVPLILLVGHHVDSRPPPEPADPTQGEAKPAETKGEAPPSYKMLLLDVTFDSPNKGDMTYTGGERSDEASAVKSAFVEFGEDNKYGDGEVVYRVPQKGLRDQVPSVTTAAEYLGYALAVLGIVLLVAGAILSAGALAPGSAAAIGAIVTGLGIAAGVAGAALAARNIYKRVEKGTFELDAEFALDVVSIIGAAVQTISTVGKIATMTRTVGAVQRALQIQRLDRLILIYDVVELSGSAILVSMKVHEDVTAIDKLPISDQQKEELKQQVAIEAVQQGAMLAYGAFSKAGEIHGAIKAKVENSRYKSFKQRGWVDEHGQPTELAPASLRPHVVEPGKPAPRAAQGEQAWKEAEVLGLGAAKTPDGDHKLTITERGRIIRCSEFCTDLRLKYGEVLGQDPALNKQMTELEEAAKAAAKAGDKSKADAAVQAASKFEGQLKDADDLRKHLFGMSQKEVDAAFDAMEAGRVTGGPKSGRKIDDVRIPRRQRRLIDVLDLMNLGELAQMGKGGWKKAMDRINKVMGRKISAIPELEAAWNAARKDVLKGKEPKDYTREQVIEMYKTAQRKFWENVRKDPKAVDFLEKQGFELPGDSGAALAKLGPKGEEATTRGNVTDQERRISLDHIDEKAQGDNWLKALDADNLELMFQNANSWKEIVQVKFGMREPTP